MEDFTGRVIKTYELKERIGEGGFGAVYRAHQQLIGREVAIKIILPQYANRPEFVRRFETEAQLVARLEHPHIVPLYDFWREPSGAYLVMRWLRGGNVQELIDKEGALELSRVGKILNQIAEALVVAHRQGVIHRDLKPENLLLDDDSNVYLSDFGIAKDTENHQTLTQNNAILGSPAYLSPEQIKGEPVTPQTDIYALGIVLYEMLTGERPFKDGTAATLMYKHLSEPIPDINIINPTLPPTVNAVLQRATAKDPTDRYDDVIQLARDFRHAVKSSVQDDDYLATPIGTAMMSVTSGSISIPDPENPYKGLRAFQQADADDFFGREVLTLGILRRLQEPTDNARFLAVVGPSGSGKSSVLKAGVLPELRHGAFPGSENWFIVEMLPGIDPMEELEAALLRIAVNPPDSLLEQLQSDERGLVRAIKRVLPDDDTELLIFIDQFEELFTLVDDDKVRRHFMDSLIVAISDPRSRVRVMVTLRADFYDRPLQYPRFGELMKSRTEIVLPMNAEELERAISGPARRVGLALEDGLVTAIVADVNEQPGALPLLQYALTELFERRDGPVLMLEAYNEIGGTMGALARRADELYENLGDEGQEAARQMFLRLVTLGEGAEDTRRRALLSELLSIGEDPDEISMVVDAFGRYRLITFDRDPSTRTATIEVAHEALIRQWGLLRGWLNESREDLRVQRRLTNIAEDWKTSGREQSYLARGARLQQFETWKESTTLALNELEQEYLNASVNERRRVEAAEEARRQREAELEKRSRDRLRYLVAVMSVATVIAVILALFAFTQQQAAENAKADAELSAAQAEVARNAAEDSAAQAQSLALAANARNVQGEFNTTLAMSLAIAATDAYHPVPVEALRVLASTVLNPGVTARLEGHTGAALSGDISADGRWIVSASSDGTIRIWDTIERSLVTTIETPDEVVVTAKFSPDAQTVLIGGTSGNLSLVDVASGEIIRAYEGHTDTVTSVAFSPDGTKALSGSLDHTLRLWDVETGETLQVMDDTAGIVLKIALAERNGVLLAASSYGDVTLVAGAPPENRDRTVRLWNAETGELLQTYALNSSFVRTVDLSPDGTRLAAATWSSSIGGTIYVWDTATGEEVQRVYGHADIVTSVKFMSDNLHLITASWDRSVRVWDVDKGIQTARFDIAEDRILDVAVSSDGEYIVAFTGNIGGNEIGREHDASADTSVWLIDLKSRAEIRSYADANDWLWDADVHPSGRYAVSGAGPLSPSTTTEFDNMLRVYDLETGEVVLVLDPHDSTIESVVFDATGEHLVSAAWDGQVILWSFSAEDGNVQLTEDRRMQFPGEDVLVLNAQISPDGKYIAAGGSDGTVALWDADTGERIRQFGSYGNAVAGIDFSPDSKRLAVSSYDSTAGIWDVETGNLLVSLIGHTDRVNDIRFSPDGGSVFTAAWDTTVRHWDANTGEIIRVYTGHRDRVQTVAVSPDGQMILSGGADTVVRLWSVETGQQIFQFAGHTNWISQVIFMPNGEEVLTSAQDRLMKLWRLPVNADSIITWAGANRYVRDLTCAEREQFRVTPLCEGEVNAE